MPSLLYYYRCCWCWCCCFCCLTCVWTVWRILLFYDQSGWKIETGETWSIFDLSNRNWAGFSLEFDVPYDITRWLYRSTQRRSQKRAFVFENSPSSNTIWIVLYSNFLLLSSTILNTDWTRISTITSATIPYNRVSFHCIFMPYCRIPHWQRCFFEFYLIYVW